MANVLDIKIKVSTEGIDKIKAFADNLQNTFGDLKLGNNEIADKIVENTEKIVESLESVLNEFTRFANDSVTEVIESSEGAAAESFQKIERIYSRGLTGLVTVFALSFRRFREIFLETLTGFSNLLSAAPLAVAGSFRRASFFFEESLTSFQTVGTLAFESLNAQASSLLGFFVSLNGQLSSFLGILSGPILQAFAIFAGNVFIGNAVQLFQRLFGLTQRINTPLGQIDLVLKSISSAILQVGLTGGQVLKTLSLGLLTFFGGPFSGLISAIPFINQLTTSILNFGGSFRVGFAAFFGSGRAQLVSVFSDIRSILFDILPLVRSIIEPFRQGFISATLENIIRRSQQFIAVIRSPIRSLTGFFTGRTRREALASVNAVLDSLLSFPKTLKDISTTLTTIGADFKKTFNLNDVFARLSATLKSFGDQVNKSLNFEQNIQKAATSAGQAIKKELPAQNIFSGFSAQAFIRETEKVTKALEPVKIAAGSARQSVAGISTEAKTFSQVAAESFDKSTQSVQKFSRETAVVTSVFFDFQRLLQSTNGSFTKLDIETKKGAEAFFNFFNALKPTSEGIDQSESRLRKFGDRLVALAAQVNSPEFAGLAARIRNSTEFKFDVAKIQKNFQELNKVAAKAAKDLKVEFKGQDFGANIITVLEEGLRKGSPKIEDTVQKIAQIIQDFFPASPAKRGPLKKLPQSGPQIVDFLAKGMVSNQDKAAKAAGTIANRIANYFPRSLPVVGPLVTIVKSGSLIPFYIGEGIRQGASQALRAIDSLAEQIQQRIEGAIQASEIADRTGSTIQGVSLLQNSIEQLGGTTTDLNFVTQQAQKLLEGTFTDEQAQTIRNLGISLEDARNSADPLVNILLQVSDVLAQVPIGSRQAQDALQLLGIQANSSLVRVLRRGSEEISGLIQGSADLGLAFNQNFVQSGEAVRKLIVIFRQVRDSFVNTFLEEVFPSFQDAGERLTAFLRDNQVRIRTFIAAIARIFNATIKLVTTVVSLAVREPAKLLEILRNALGNFLVFAGRFINQVLNIIQGQAGTKIFELLTTLGLAFRNFVVSFSKLVIAELDILIDRIIILAKKLVIEVALILEELVVSDVGDIFLGLLRRLGGLLQSIGDLIIASLKDLGKFLVDIALGIIKDIISTVTDFIKNNQTVRNAFEFLFGEEATRQIVNIGDLAGEGLEQRNFLSNTARELDKLTKSFQQSIINVDQDEEELEKKIRERSGLTAKLFVEGFRQAQEDALKIIEATSDAGSAIFSEDQVNELLSNFDGLITGLQTTVENTELEGPFKDFLDAVALKDIEEIKERYNELEAKAIEVSENIAASTPENSLADPEFTPPPSLAGQEQNFFTGFGGLFENLTTLGSNFGNLKEFPNLVKEVTSQLNVMNGVLGDTSKLFGEVFDLTGLKEFAAAQKAVDIGIAISKGAIAVINALTTLPPPLSFIQAGQTAALVGIQVGKIAAQNFADGGIVQGPGTPTSDSVPANLSVGEGVLPFASMVKMGGQAFEGLRTGNFNPEALRSVVGNVGSPLVPRIPNFASGGAVGRSLAQSTQQSQQQQQPPIEIYNLDSEDKLFSRLQSSKGRNLVFNILEEDPVRTQRIFGNG